MRVVFLGSGAFGIPTLELLVAQHDVSAVVTAPDQRRGRGRETGDTPIAQWADAHQMPLQKLADVNVQDARERLSCDAMVVVAFGQMIGPDLVEDRLAINLHGSMLPRWRGAAPIQRAIAAGDATSGVSVITLAQELDAGDVLASEETPIAPLETAGELHDRLALLGAPLVCSVLAAHEAGALDGAAQDHAAATYASKIHRSDAALDLSQDASTLAALVRGMSPRPGCQLRIGQEQCKLLRAVAHDAPADAPIGTLLDDGHVATGSGTMQLLDLQPAGGRAMDWADYARGRSVESGTICEGTC